MSLYASQRPWPAYLGCWLVNRCQILYTVLFLPRWIGTPDQLWVIPAVALLSILNLRLLAGWLRTEQAAKGYDGFVELFGETPVRLFAGLGVPLLSFECCTVTLGYAKTVSHTLFPTVSDLTFAVLILAGAVYLAAYGMSATGSFSLIAFLGSIWILIFYFQFFTIKDIDIHYLYPLLETPDPVRLFPTAVAIWAAYAGPELLAFTGKWFGERDRLFRWFALGNALTCFEYVLLTVVSFLFFGESFLERVDQPVVYLIRYIELPFFERLEILIVSFYMFPFLFHSAFSLLLLAGAVRIAAGLRTPPGRATVLGCAVLAAAVVFFVHRFVFVSETGRDDWTKAFITAAGIHYAVLPTVLWTAARLKRRRGT